jgi:hypothetical protein
MVSPGFSFSVSDRSYSVHVICLQYRRTYGPNID